MNKIDYINEKIKVRNKTLVVQLLDICSNLMIAFITLFTNYANLTLFLTWLIFQAFAKTYAYSGIKKMTNISREFELKFGEELKRDVKDLKKQLREELLKQKANEFVVNEKDNNEEIHVYNISKNNSDNMVIDMELNDVYQTNNKQKTLRKIKERRY